MSHAKSTSNLEKSNAPTYKLHGQARRTASLDNLKTPEEEAAVDRRSLIHQTLQRELDIVDGLQSTADVIDKILDMMSDLMKRMRNIEALTIEKPQPPVSKGGCGLYCSNNSFEL